MSSIPAKQYAVQLIGPDKLCLNPEKPLLKPGPHQILARVEAVGLCFSDLKLLKQFSEHPRKSPIIAGLPAEILKEIPSYVPDNLPTVPGHEAVVRIVALGDRVRKHRIGERCLVQADYREQLTAVANAAFGYNFEGGLQEFVIIDERVIVDSVGERYLLPAKQELSASAIALVEPWACVEDSYVTEERRHIRPNGKLLLVVDADSKPQGLRAVFADQAPGDIYFFGDAAAEKCLPSALSGFKRVEDLQQLPAESFDDIVYFGAKAEVVELLDTKLASHGILNLVLSGKELERNVSIAVGRVHYAKTRIIGTKGNNASEAYGHIPPNGELRDYDHTLIVGAAGPMGQMHLIRAVCSEKKKLTVVGSDVDDERLSALANKAKPFVERNFVDCTYLNTKKEKLVGKFSYIALMAPLGQLVEEAIELSTDRCLINIFAGIPASVRHELNLNRYIENRVFMFGTSGSTIRDMKLVLDKLEKGILNTNCSVDAVCGMAGAVDGIRAVEKRSLAGKIIVYPQLHHLGLTPLRDLAQKYPTVNAKLEDGQWSKEAEVELLRVAEEA